MISPAAPSRARLLTIHRSPLAVAGLYLVISCVMLWPLPMGMTRDLPADLGDPLLNMWILDWMATGIGRVATGAMSVADLWNANIFHPEPMALAFSEHLFGETLQMLPIYAMSGNLILSYNLLFLSTYVLAGLGMYLLAYDLTGRRDAAFVAGAMFAFAPLRVAQLSHIQILSAQWMPFALYALRRYAATGRLQALVGATAALLMLAWSSGYYLIYFSPFVPLFTLHQLHVHGRLGNSRVWLGLIGAMAAVAIGSYPFLMMYADARQMHGFERPLGEVIQFSADLGGYLTASEMLRVWGDTLRLAPKPEGEVFLGFVPMLLAAVAIGSLLHAAWRDSRATPAASGWRRFVAVALFLGASVQLVGLGVAVVSGGFVRSVAGITIRATDAGRALSSLTLALALLLVVAPRARHVAATATRSWMPVAAAMGLLAVWLSLGPRPSTLGEPIDGLGLYRWLFDHAPGFDGLRVPARYAMVADCFLLMIAAAGAATIMRQCARPSVAAAVLTVLVLAEGFAAPIPLNATWGDGSVVPPPRVFPAPDAPAVYHALAALPGRIVVAEFPFGDPAWELRYVYYATVHRQRLLNGYSGGFPRGYLMRVASLQRLTEDPERAWRTLGEAGTTHVVLHRDATSSEHARAIDKWLTAHGARVISAFDQDVLYQLPLR